MSVLEEIRKLDEQKAKLLEGAKIEALNAAKAAISTLAELGFNYTLVQGEGSGAISTPLAHGVLVSVRKCSRS